MPVCPEDELLTTFLDLHSGPKCYQTSGGFREVRAPYHPSPSRQPDRHSEWPQLQHEVSSIPQCQVYSCSTNIQIRVKMFISIVKSVNIRLYIPVYISQILMSLSLSHRGNVILDESALKSLRLVSKTLQALVISENPLVETTDYRLSVLILLPQLERLDKDPVSPEERTEAQERIKVKLKKHLNYACDWSDGSCSFLVAIV